MKEHSLDYLAFAASSAKVKQVMQRRIARLAAAHDDDPAPMLSEMDRVLVDLIARAS